MDYNKINLYERERHFTRSFADPEDVMILKASMTKDETEALELRHLIDDMTYYFDKSQKCYVDILVFKAIINKWSCPLPDKHEEWDAHLKRLKQISSNLDCWWIYKDILAPDQYDKVVTLKEMEEFVCNIPDDISANPRNLFPTVIKKM